MRAHGSLNNSRHCRASELFDIDIPPDGRGGHAHFPPFMRYRKTGVFTQSVQCLETHIEAAASNGRGRMLGDSLWGTLLQNRRWAFARHEFRGETSAVTGMAWISRHK